MKIARRPAFSTVLHLGVALFGLMAAGSAQATFHLWRMTELFSNADGSVQYLELATSFSGEQFLGDHTLTSNGRVFTFPNGLPGDSGRKTFLVGTEGFAALKLVTPDYTVPNGFFNAAGGSVDFAGVDTWDHPPLPTDGRRSLDRGTGAPGIASPFNFAGDTAPIDLTAAPAGNYQGLWWRSPGGSENGWGVNVAHQGDVLFTTWYTYDTDGTAMWLFSDVHKTTGTTYAGQLYQATGAPFSAYDGARFSPIFVGNVTFAFADGDNGTFSYTAKGVTQSKAITKFKFTSPVPTCAAGTAVSGTNYTDLWLVMDSAAKIADRTYRGNVYRTTSAPFSA